MPASFAHESIAFFLGLLFGSFLNVCISRLPRGESIVAPRSRCPHCGKPIRWYDNIPLLSWLLLRARCRDCGAPISPVYPTVELALGLWFAVDAHLANTASMSGDHAASLTLYALPLAVLGFLLIGLAVMDWQTLLLPNAFTLTGIALGFFVVCTQAIFLNPGEGDVVFNSTHQLRLSSPGSFASQGNVFLTGPEALVFGRVGALLIVTLLLLAIRGAYQVIRRREGMGLGDVKLLAMIATFLGLWQAILALLVGVFAASLYGVVLLVGRRGRADSRLPFGSFLAAGGLVAALLGPKIVAWYTALLR